MRSIDRERKALEELAGRALGLSTRVSRTFASQVEAQGLEAQILALPVYTGSVQELQDASGTARFMWGLDAFGGSSPF